MIIHCDRRGYCLVKLPDGRYKAGCRGPWTRDQALAHWGGANYPYPDRGAQFVQSIEADVEITALPAGLKWLHLGGGTLPAGVALPAGLEWLRLGGGTLPAGVALPAGLVGLSLGGGTLPAGVALPDGLKWLYLGGGTLPAGVALPDGLKRLYLDGGTLPAGVALPATARLN